MAINLTTTTSNVTVDATTNTITVGSTPSNVTVSTKVSGVSNTIIRNALTVSDTGGDGSLTYDNGTGIFTYTGPSAAEVRSHFTAQSPINLDSGTISINESALFSGKTTDDLAEGTTNLYLNGTGTTSNLTEGTNLYFTDGRSRASISVNTNVTPVGNGALDYNSVTGVITYTPADSQAAPVDSVNGQTGVVVLDTGDLQESGNLFYTDARSRGAISIGTAGGSGLGELQYNSTTGVFDFYSVQPNEIRAMFSGVSPITFNSGNGEIGLDGSTLLDNSTTDDLAEGTTNLYFTTDRSNTAVTAHFANASAAPFVFNGNVDVQGNLNYVNVEDLLVNDRSITLNYGNVAQDAQIFVDRTGAGGSNVDLKWNETTDKWQFTNDGSTYQDIGSFAGNTTDSLPEGTTNLYFSNTRVTAAILGNEITTKDILETVAVGEYPYNTGTANVSGTWSIVPDFGSRFHGRLIGDITYLETNGVDEGHVCTLVMQQDSVGGRVLDLTTTPGNWTDWTFVNDYSTLSSDPDAIDVMTFFKDDESGKILASLINFTSTGLIQNSELANSNVIINGKTINLGDTTDLTGLTGNIDITGNVNGTYFHGDGSNISGLTTDIVSEGTNLYYTNNRVDNQIDAYLTGGTGIDYSLGTIDLADTAVTPGTYGDALNVSQVTVDQQGRITSVTDVAIASGSGTVTSVTAGDGMTQSGTSTIDPTLDVVGGFGITVNADNIELANADVLTLLDSGVGTGNINTTGTITAGLFEGPINGAVLLKVHNNTGTTIDKGNVVYLTGGNNGDNPYVDNAKADSSTTMPAFGIAYENIPASLGGEIVTLGELTGLDLTGFTTGDHLFVSTTTAGAFQNTQPTTEANLIQNIGKVVKGGTGGALEFTGAGRTNATPNLDRGNMFLGSTSNTSVAVTPSNNFKTLSNAFDLSNTLSNVNTITTEATKDLELYANKSAGKTEFYSQYGADSTNTNVGSIAGDGYSVSVTNTLRYNLNVVSQGNIPTLLNDSAQNIDAYAFAGTVTAGSNQMSITDGGSFSSFNNNGGQGGSGFTSDFTTAKSGIGQYCGWNDILASMWLDGTSGQTSGFPTDVYVVSVDTVGNTITMSENAIENATFTQTSPIVIPQGAVNTQTGFCIDIFSQNDLAVTSSRTAMIGNDNIGFGLWGVRKRTNNYAFPLSGPTQDDFQWSLGSSSDWTFNLGTAGNREKFLRQRSSLEIEQGHFKAPQGLMVGSSTEMSNRGFGDPITGFGINVMWDGLTDSTNLNDFVDAGQALPQILMKSYTTGTFQGVGASQISRGGPRLFFSSATGSVDTPELETYPLTNQELGRLAFWGSAGNTATPSSINVPALINVNAHDDWTVNGASGVGGNADMHFAATSNKDVGADVFMSYEAGELVLASGKTTTSANIVLAPALQSNNGNVSSAYSGAVHQYARANYYDVGTETGSRLAVVQGTNSASAGIISLGLTREAIAGTDTVNLDTAFNGAVTNGGSVGFGSPDDDGVLVIQDGSSGAFSTIESDGTQITIAGGTGTNIAAVAGGTYYAKTIASEDPFGDGTAIFLYTDSGTTTRASASALGISGFNSSGGTASYSVTGVSAIDWDLELESSGTDLKLKADSNTKVTFTESGDLTAIGTVTGDVGDFESVPLKQFTETVVALGNQGGDISSQLDANNGSIYTVTATSDLTIDSIANAQTGTSMKIIVIQDGTGGKILNSTMRFEGGSTTLSSGSGARDIIDVFFDGSDYYAKIGLNYS